MKNNMTKKFIWGMLTLHIYKLKEIKKKLIVNKVTIKQYLSH